MSTRSNIGILRSNGTCESIYCHSDGYEDGVGKVLFKHYTTITKVEELIALGDISCLSSEIGVKHPFDSRDIVYHNMCLAYHRDRGEELHAATKSRSKNDILSIDNGAKYTYLFVEKTGKWTYKHHYGASSRWHKLTAKICKANEQAI